MQELLTQVLPPGFLLNNLQATGDMEVPRDQERFLLLLLPKIKQLSDCYIRTGNRNYTISWKVLFFPVHSLDDYLLLSKQHYLDPPAKHLSVGKLIKAHLQHPKPK